MSDEPDRLRRYVEQRMELGEEWVMLPADRELGGSTGERIAASLEPDTRAPAAPSPAATPRPSSADSSSRRSAPSRKWQKDLPSIPGPGIVIAPPPKDLFTADPLAGASLEQLAAMIRDCTKCGLCEHRSNAVPGEGPADARLAVVGEGPGATEDETGRPFVGRAGELLTDILKAIDLPRERVFICNVVKCRPPSNRTPQHDEIEACVPYLYRQLEILQPAVILAMGGTAAQTLLSTKQSLGSMRNKVHDFRGVPLVVTYHPAALLRNPHWKKPTWDDVRIARQLLDG